MSAHTPAPWRIAGKATIRAGEGWICNVHWRNREANATLISASPDMLSALLYVREMVESGQEFGMSRINAAIARARGQS